MKLVDLIFLSTHTRTKIYYAKPGRSNSIYRGYLFPRFRQGSTVTRTWETSNVWSLRLGTASFDDNPILATRLSAMHRRVIVPHAYKTWLAETGDKYYFSLQSVGISFKSRRSTFEFRSKIQHRMHRYGN